MDAADIDAVVVDDDVGAIVRPTLPHSLHSIRHRIHIESYCATADSGADVDRKAAGHGGTLKTSLILAFVRICYR